MLFEEGFGDHCMDLCQGVDLKNSFSQGSHWIARLSKGYLVTWRSTTSQRKRGVHTCLRGSQAEWDSEGQGGHLLAEDTPKTLHQAPCRRSNHLEFSRGLAWGGQLFL